MFPKHLIKLMLLLVLLSNLGTVQSRAAQTYCLQFDTGFASHFYVANPQDKTIKPLPDNQPAFPYLPSEFSEAAPGGRYIAQVQAARGKETANGDSSLVVGDRLTWHVSVLQTGNRFNFAWSPDGRSIAYIWQVGHGNQIATYFGVANADGTDERLSPIEPLDMSFRLSWSADSKYIALLSFTRNESRLFSTITLKPVSIISSRISNRSFSWSPRGNQFFAWIDSPTQGKFVVATPEKGIEHEFDAEVMGFIPEYGNPFWTADSTHVALVQIRNEQARINILNVIDGSIWGPLDGPEQEYDGEGLYATTRHRLVIR